MESDVRQRRLSRLPVAFALLAGLAVAPAARAQVSEAEGNFNVGLTHLREGRPNFALDEFKKAVRQDGKNPYFYKGLGLAYAALKQYPDAIGAFRMALEINPYYVDVRNDLGTALMLSGKRAEGKNEFLVAFNDPTNPTPEISARNLGQAYLEEKNYPDATTWFHTSLGRNKKYTDAYLGLSDALAGAGHADEAITTLETAAAECPDSAVVMENLGEAYYRAGRLADARKRLEEARKKDPLGPVGRRAGEVLQKLK